MPYQARLDVPAIALGGRTDIQLSSRLLPWRSIEQALAQIAQTALYALIGEGFPAMRSGYDFPACASDDSVRHHRLSTHKSQQGLVRPGIDDSEISVSPSTEVALARQTEHIRRNP